MARPSSPEQQNMSNIRPGAEETPLKFELMQADDYGKYLLRARLEIMFLLRELMRRKSLITVYFNEGNDYLLTAVLGVDEQGMVLDYGANEDMNQKALASNRLIFIASHDRVKVQFSASRLELVQLDGRPAFRTALPDTLLRLQRREYYRLVTPGSRPIKCVIPVLDNHGQHPVEASVLDISAGGIAIVAPPDGLPFKPLTRYDNCQITLPDVGTIVTTLEVRNIFDITLKNGTRVKRAGCQFTHLDPLATKLIQRFIIRAERDMRANQSGIA